MSIRGFFSRLRPYPDSPEMPTEPVKRAPSARHRYRSRLWEAPAGAYRRLPRSGLWLTLVRLAAALALLIPGLAAALPAWGRTGLLAASAMLSGYDAAVEAVWAIAEKRVFDENLLVTAAVLLAFCAGKGSAGAIAMLFFLLGGLLLRQIVAWTQRTVSAYADHCADTANVRRGEGIETIPAADVKPGDVILVSPGELVPLDGVVLAGSSALDVSAITGDPAPLDVAPGDTVQAGSRNLLERLTVRVTAAYADSAAPRIRDIVLEAEHYRAKPELYAERFAKYFAPAVAALAVLVGLLAPLISGQEFTIWAGRGLTILLAAGPCALVFSVPLAYYAGLGGGAGQGILFRGADILAETAETGAVVFDKTGTLTAGVFTVAAVYPRGLSEEALLRLAACAESFSAHPVAKGVAAACAEPPDKSVVRRFAEQPGMGVVAELANGTVVAAGSEALMQKLDIVPDAPARAGIPVHVAAGGHYAGCILLEDALKQDAINAVSALERMGVRRVAMLTGDKRESAEAVAKILHIREVYAECPAEEKAERIRSAASAMTAGERLVFVGDGVSDADALQEADIGMAMGGLAAAGSADVILMADEPIKAAEAVERARLVRRIVRQNIAGALVCKLFVILLGLAGVAPVWLAVPADLCVMLLAVGNAMRAVGSPPFASLGGLFKKSES